MKLPEGLVIRGTEFDVEKDDFSKLEVRAKNGEERFHYFYDVQHSRLITDFILEDRPQVPVMCTVTLIRDQDSYSPRLSFWKKDKSKADKPASDFSIPDNDDTRMIKSLVDLGSAYQGFWKLIDFLQSFKDVALPSNEFRVVSASSAQLAEQLKGRDRQTVLEAVSTFLEGSLTQDDIHLLANRRGQLRHFERLLEDEDFFASEQIRLGLNGREKVWQVFFEENPWIFGYGLNIIACEKFDDAKLERATSGASIFQGAGKRSDAVMRSRGVISSLLFCEIKTHETDLLMSAQYRSGVYQVSSELGGAVSQVQKTADKAFRGVTDYVRSHYESDGTPTDIEYTTVRPKQVVVIGSLQQMMERGKVNPERISSFELFRNSFTEVDIITFDELYQRARFIVEDA